MLIARLELGKISTGQGYLRRFMAQQQLSLLMSEAFNCESFILFYLKPAIRQKSEAIIRYIILH